MAVLLLLLPLSTGCKKEKKKKKSLFVCFRKWRVSEMCCNLTSMQQQTQKRHARNKKKKKRIFTFSKPLPSCRVCVV
jgi:hypothetical protein